MTNFERYKDDVLNWLDDFAVDKITGRARRCGTTANCCRDCLFNFGCNAERLRWLYEECQEPSVDWSKVPIDTKVLVSDDGATWYKRHFAGVNSVDKPTVYPNGLTSWTIGDITFCGVSYKYIKLAEEE